MKICSVHTSCFSMVSCRVLGFHQRGGSLSTPKMKAEKMYFSRKYERDKVVSWGAALVFNHCWRSTTFIWKAQAAASAACHGDSLMCSNPVHLWSQPSCLIAVLPDQGRGSWHTLRPRGQRFIAGTWLHMSDPQPLVYVSQVRGAASLVLGIHVQPGSSPIAHSSQQFRGLSEGVF